MSKKLESSTMLSFIIFGMLGIRLVSLPHDLAEIAKNDSWASIIIISILAFFNIYTYIWLYSKYPGLNYSQILERNLGKFLGKVSMLLFFISAASAIALSLRFFAENLNMYLLEKTPQLVIMLVMLFTCFYALKLDMYSIGIVLELLLPVSLFFIILMFLLSLHNADFKNLQPLFHQGIAPILKGALYAADPIGGIGIILYILPFFKDSVKIKKWALLGTGISMLIYLMVVIMCITALGSSELNYLIFPVMVVAKSIELETPLFERVESLFMTSWIPITFAAILLIYLISTLNLKVLFNTKKNNLIIILQAPLFIFMARLPKSIAQVMEYSRLLSVIILLTNIIHLILMIIITIIKERSGKLEVEDY